MVLGLVVVIVGIYGQIGDEIDGYVCYVSVMLGFCQLVCCLLLQEQVKVDFVCMFGCKGLYFGCIGMVVSFVLLLLVVVIGDILVVQVVVVGFK